MGISWVYITTNMLYGYGMIEKNVQQLIYGIIYYIYILHLWNDISIPNGNHIYIYGLWSSIPVWKFMEVRNICICWPPKKMLGKPQTKNLFVNVNGIYSWYIIWEYHV